MEGRLNWLLSTPLFSNEGEDLIKEESPPGSKISVGCCVVHTVAQPRSSTAHQSNRELHREPYSHREVSHQGFRQTPLAAGARGLSHSLASHCDHEQASCFGTFFPLTCQRADSWV
jgi:hypothetical protein